MDAGIEVIQREIKRLDGEIKSLTSQRDALIQDRDILLESRRGQQTLIAGNGSNKELGESLAAMALSILQNSGAPMDVESIRNEMVSRGRDAAPNTIHGILNREIKLGRTFNKPERGLFGLLEWTDVSGGSPTLGEVLSSFEEKETP